MMEDKKEFTNLDALFRQTFEELPDTPSPSGWDTPSPHVWEGIRTHLQTMPRARAGSYLRLLLIGIASTALLIGLYWVFLRPTPVRDASGAANVVAQDISTEKEKSAPSAEVIPIEPPAHLVPSQKPKAKLPSPTPYRRAEPLMPSSAPLPGSVPAPNTTIRREVDALRRAPWAQPLQPLPTRMGARRHSPPPGIYQLLFPGDNSRLE